MECLEINPYFYSGIDCYYLLLHMRMIVQYFNERFLYINFIHKKSMKRNNDSGVLSDCHLASNVYTCIAITQKALSIGILLESF